MIIKRLEVIHILDYRINTFLELCKTMNYTRTAKVLFITQPAVTGHIQFLEKEYGIKLFHYQGKQLTLSSAGEALRQYSLTANINAQQMKLQLARATNAPGSLCFGATKTIGEFCITPVLSDMLVADPNLNITVTVDNTTTLLALLEEGKIEFALIEGFFESKKYEHRLVANENFVGVCSAQSHLAGRDLSFDALIEERLILREEGSGTRDICQGILLEHNLHFNDFHGCIEANSPKLIVELVKGNKGITFLYESAVATEIKAGSILPLRLQHFTAKRQFNLVYLKNCIFEAKVHNFFQLLQNGTQFHM